MFADQFNQIINARRSVRIYDEQADFDESAVKRSIERAILSPNSSNMQLWEFYWVKSAENKAKITHACLAQSAAKTANNLVVFVGRRDFWPQRAKWNLENMRKQFAEKELTGRDKRALEYYSKLMPLVYRYDWLGLTTLVRVAFCTIMGFRKPFLKIYGHGDQRVMVQKSCALAAQTFMLSMQAEGYNTCPMEGFDSSIVKNILGLPAAAEVCMIVACGKGKPEGIYAERTRVPNNEVIIEC